MNSKPSPEELRDLALKRFQELAKPKYDKGQQEHGGHLMDRYLFDEMEKELVDAWFYLQALKTKYYNAHPFDDI